MHEEIFKKSVHSLSDIINTWTGCPLKTAVMFLTKTDALIVHSVMYFLKAKFFIVGIWVGHRIRHAELYLLAENWLLLLTNLLFNDSVSMLFFIVMNTGLLIRWSDKCAVCLENYAGLKVLLWRIKKGKEPIKCWHLKEKGSGNAEGTEQFFVFIICMQVFGQNSQLVSEIHYAQLKTNFSSGFNIFYWSPKGEDWNVLYKQESNMVPWKASLKIRWLQLP